jgi:hypothetical protein
MPSIAGVSALLSETWDLYFDTTLGRACNLIPS